MESTLHIVVACLSSVVALGTILGYLIKALFKNVNKEMAGIRSEIAGIHSDMAKFETKMIAFDQRMDATNQRLDGLYQICIDLLKDRNNKPS